MNDRKREIEGFNPNNLLTHEQSLLNDHQYEKFVESMWLSTNKHAHKHTRTIVYNWCVLHH